MDVGGEYRSGLGQLSISADAASQEKTVFMQVYKQLGHLDPACLRQNERAFKVTLRGERVEGEGTKTRIWLVLCTCA
jgi:hypothetical protein